MFESTYGGTDKQLSHVLMQDGKGSMEPTDSAAIESPTLESFLNQPDHFSIFTHSIKTRLIILGVFMAYLIFFTLFIGWLHNEFVALMELPVRFQMLGGARLQRILFYIIAAMVVLTAIAVLFYFFWAVIDIWGLQIWCSRRSLRVQNTFTGPMMARWTGVGTILMEDIVEIKGGKLFTLVSSKTKQVRFSPVDHLDALIASILANAPDAKIN